MEIIELVSQTKVFNHLSKDKIRSLVECGISHSYEKDQWVVHQGDIWPYLFLLLEGDIVALKESVEGRSLILETFGEGEVFWGLAFFLDAAPMPAGLRASTGCKLISWSRQFLYPFLLESSQLSWELAQMAIRRALRASEIVDELAFQPVTGRLARFLVERFGEGGQEPVVRSMTLDEMAAHIGSTREMVCRILQRFANQGMIDITRTEFTFTDRERLKQVAQICSE